MVANVLFLDIATKTGYCFGEPGQLPRHGVINFGGKGKQDGEIFAAFHLWLNDRMTVDGSGLLAFEAPILGGGRATPATARRLMGLAAIAEMTASERGVRCVEEHLATIKKSFTGSGRADEHAVIAKCRQLGLEPHDDNAADAIAGWFHTNRKFFPKIMGEWESTRFGLVGR